MKRNLKLLLSLVMFVAIAVSFSLTANAALFDMSVIEEDTTDEFWRERGIHKIEDEYLKQPIKSFDVNDKGFVVIATTNNMLIVLDDNNEQVSAISFENYGDYFVKWNGENILLFLVRGDDIVQMNMNGDFISKIIVNKDDWETARKWRELSKLQSSVVMNNNEYRLKSSNAVLKIFNSLYSTIEKVDANGNIVTVYDVTEKYNGMAFLFCTFHLLVVGIMIYFFVRLYIENKIYMKQKAKFSHR